MFFASYAEEFCVLNTSVLHAAESKTETTEYKELIYIL